MHFAKLALAGVGTLIAALILAAISLYIATMGEHGVARTVIDNPELGSTEIAGFQLHTEMIGDDGAPVVIALHGGPGGDMRSMAGLQGLSDTYRIVFYDQRGAGLSERVPAEALTLDGYLEELDALIDRVSPNAPVALVGHSWGAMLASAYLGEQPEKVSRAILIEPGFLDAAEAHDWFDRSRDFMSGPDFLWEAIVTGFEAAHVKGDAHASDDYLMGKMSHAFATHPDNPYHCPDEPFRGWSWRFGALASKTAAATPDADFDRLAGGTTYPGPVLFMAGACNSWIGPDLQAKHAASFQNADLAVIPDAGHDLLSTRTDEALDVMRRFLR